MNRSKDVDLSPTGKLNIIDRGKDGFSIHIMDYYKVLWTVLLEHESTTEELLLYKGNGFYFGDWEKSPFAAAQFADALVAFERLNHGKGDENRRMLVTVAGAIGREFKSKLP